MKRPGLSAVATLMLAAILAAGGEPARAGGEEPSVPRSERSAAEELGRRIKELRLEARYGEASVLAEELLRLLRDDPQARAFEVGDVERLIGVLGGTAALAEDDRRALARADSLWVEYADAFGEGRYQDSQDAVERRLEIQRRLLNPEHIEVAESLNALGTHRLLWGEFVEGEALFREALAIRRKILGEDHPATAESIDDLGDLFRVVGDYEEAEPLLRKGLAIRTELLGSDHVDTGESLNNLAACLQARGEYAEAETLYRRSLAIMRACFPEGHSNVAFVLNNLATLLFDQRDYVAAEPLFHATLEMLTALFGRENPYVAATHNNIAVLLHARGRYDEAEPHYREALELRRAIFGEEHADVAQTLNNFAGLLDDRGDHAAAEPLFREALELRRQMFGDDHIDVAASLEDLGISLEARGDYDPAEEFHREALAVRRRQLGDAHPAVATSLSHLASISAALGDWATAEQHFAEASAVYDVARLRAGAGLARATFQSSPYPGLAAARLALGRDGDAWPAAEKAQARLLADLLAVAEKRELTPSEAAREDSLRWLLVDLEDELAALSEAATRDTTGEVQAERERARTALLSAEADWSALEQELAATYPVTEGEVFPLARVQAALEERAAIIGWLDVEIHADRYESWCYAVRKTGPVVWARVVPPVGGVVPRSPFERVRSLRRSLADPGSPALIHGRLAREIYDERVAPLGAALDPVQDLIVVPSGAMIGVPVEALTRGDGVPLGESYAVSYAPSATVFAWMRKRPVAASPGRALLVADPPFNVGHLAAMEREAGDAVASSEPMPSRALLRSALARNEDVLATLPRLRGAREEVTGVGALMAEVTSLVGPEASEEALDALARSGRLREYGTIHIATHALVDDERPELSALVLSQIDRRDPLEVVLAGEHISDGLVTSEEILRRWDLEAHLVTLSACETGLGKKVTGEGYVGFAHTFLQAGARSLLVSLWKVDDRATSLLMRRFYRNWLGAPRADAADGSAPAMSKSEALREAKLWLRSYTDEYGGRPYEHPYYWSAFILLGDRS